MNKLVPWEPELLLGLFKRSEFFKSNSKISQLLSLKLIREYYPLIKPTAIFPLIPTKKQEGIPSRQIFLSS